MKMTDKKAKSIAGTVVNAHGNKVTLLRHRESYVIFSVHGSKTQSPNCIQ